MKAWKRILLLFSIHGGSSRNIYQLEDQLHSELVKLAERENRLASEVQAELLASALSSRYKNGELWSRWESLSPREQQVSALACLGFTNRQMAGRLAISEETVKTHMKNALVKFNLHGKGELRHELKEWDFSGWE